MELHPIVEVVLVIAGPTGAAWAGVRAGLNGTRQHVKDLTAEMREVRRELSDVRERVARVEAQYVARR